MKSSDLFVIDLFYRDGPVASWGGGGGVQVRSINVYLMKTFSREYVWGNWYFYCYTYVIFQGGGGGNYLYMT